MSWLSKKRRSSYNVTNETYSSNGRANDNFQDDENDFKLTPIDLMSNEDKKVNTIESNKQKDAKTVNIGNEVKAFELLKYSDCLDKFLMVFGLIAALASEGSYPLIFILLGQSVNIFVDIQREKFQQQTSTQSIFTNFTLNETSFNKCFNQPNSQSSGDKLTFVIIAYIVIGCISVLLGYIGHVCWNTSAERTMLFNSIIRQDMAFFDKTNPGDLNTKITSNVNNLSAALGPNFPNAVSMLSRGVACLVFGFVRAWKFTIVFTALVPLISLSTAALVFMIKKYTIKEFQSYEAAGRIAQEVLSSIRTVHTFGLEKKKMEEYKQKLANAESISIKKGATTGFFLGLFPLLFYSMFAVTIYWGTYLVRTECETYDAGSIVQAIFCLLTATFAFGQAMPYFKDLAEAKGAAKSLFAIIEKKSEIDVETSKGQKFNKLKGDIEFEDVFFNYPSRPDAKILLGVTLKIPTGKTVALCGASGNGKSTVIQLLQRFYNPLSGSIKIDGVSVKDLDLKWMRSNMALVQQEPVLFAISIKENIRLGRLDATDDEIIEAAKQANAHNFIMKLNEGYDTLVGERGSQMSGGQKQRIAIARALIRNPKILLLDEATSALDLESEKVVQDALDKAKVGRTTIIIAHRLSTIRNADMIVGMAGGRVAEIGTHDELMELKGVYHELVTLQTKDAKTKEIEKNKEDNEFQDSEIVQKDVYDDAELDDLDEEDDIVNNNDTINQSQSLYKGGKKGKKLKKPFKLERKIWALHIPELFYVMLGALGRLIDGASLPVVAIIFNEIYAIFAMSDIKKQEEESLKMMIRILIVAFATFFAAFSYSYSFDKASACFITRLRSMMFNSMVKQEIAWHDMDEHRSSILATRLSTTPNLAKGLSVDFVNLIFQGFSGFGVAMIVSLIMNWKLALVLMAFTPITFFGGILSAKSSFSSNDKGKSVVEEGGRLTTECVENIKTVISLGREDFFDNQFKKLFKQKWKKTLAMLHIQGFAYGLTNSILFFIQATTFGYGYVLIKEGSLSVSDMFRIYASITFSSIVLGRVFSQFPDQNKAREAAKTALRIIHRVTKIDALSDKGKTLDIVKGEFKFENVHFKYPTRTNRVLRGLNLTIPPGETNALVGESGCGKSTTIQLILRFYDVDKGRILLDGVDIRELNLRWLRSQIGLVSQEPILFDCSIKQNIMYGDINRDDISMDEIVEAVSNANIRTKIENLPEKYETNVGIKGNQLSGGEKQRVALARALIRKPKILLLDEATSALDTQSEEIVQDALDKAQKGRTSICIAHRLSTIQNAPKITVFKDGKVLEEGPHAVLMENKSLYFTLQSQNGPNN